MANAERAGRNRRAVDATIRELRGDGRIADGHAAVVELVQSLAEAVDRAPSNASLWREYRAALLDLERATRTESDAYADLVSRLHAPVGDEAN